MAYVSLLSVAARLRCDSTWPRSTVAWQRPPLRPQSDPTHMFRRFSVAICSVPSPPSGSWLHCTCGVTMARTSLPVLACSWALDCWQVGAGWKDKLLWSPDLSHNNCHLFKWAINWRHFWTISIIVLCLLSRIRYHFIIVVAFAYCNVYTSY